MPTSPTSGTRRLPAPACQRNFTRSSFAARGLDLRRSYWLPLSLLTLSLPLAVRAGDTRQITVTNNCDYTVWPGLFTSVGDKPNQDTGWEAKAGSSLTFEVNQGWGGRIWPRTDCDFSKSDVPDYQQCATGGCKGGLQCDKDSGTGVLPCTLAEFNLQTDVDNYDTSNVDGFNVPLAVTNDAGCSLSNCPYNLLTTCPDKLQKKNDAGDVIGCLTDCGADGSNEEYCCSGAHSTPDKCPSSAIPNYPWWKSNCPIAYAYAYDESSGTALFTCTGGKANYQITFCPGPDYFSSSALLPNGSTITQGADYPDVAAGTATGGGLVQPGSTVAGDGGGKTSGGGGAASSGGGGAASSGGDAGKTSDGGSKESGSKAASGSASAPKTSAGSSAKASATGASGSGSSGSSSAGSGSASSGSSGSSGSTSSDTSDDSSPDGTILGMPTTTAYIVLALVALLVLGGIGFFLYSQKNKDKKHHHRGRTESSGTDSDSDEKSDAGSSDDTPSSDDDDAKHHKRHKRHSSGSSDDGDYSLSKLDAFAIAERRAARASIYKAAVLNPRGLDGVRDDMTARRQQRSGGAETLFELPKGFRSSSEEDGAARAAGRRRRLQENLL